MQSLDIQKSRIACTHEKDVDQNAAKNAGLNHAVFALDQRDDGDNELDRISKGCIQQTSNGRACEMSTGRIPFKQVNTFCRACSGTRVVANMR